jgi:hypothetical protein
VVVLALVEVVAVVVIEIVVTECAAVVESTQLVVEMCGVVAVVGIPNNLKSIYVVSYYTGREEEIGRWEEEREEEGGRR